MDLKGTRILVTGGTSGIGKAIADALAAAGANVEAIGKQDADLADPAAIASLAKRIEASGALDWIVHSAGYVDMDEPTGGNPSTLETTFAVNTFAPILLNRALNATLSSNGGVIHIASTAGLGGNGKFPIYAASKAAIIAYAKSLAFAWEVSGKRSITIAPGPTNTPMREAFGDAQQQQSPAAIAELAVRICSGEGKNGDVFVVRDGAVSLAV